MTVDTVASEAYHDWSGEASSVFADCKLDGGDGLAYGYSISLLLGFGDTWASVFVILQPSNLFCYESNAKKDITAFLFSLLLMAEG